MIQVFWKNTFVLILCLVAISHCTTKHSENDPPTTGDPAPVFAAKDSEGNTWKLADHIGNKLLVIYFFPAAMTGG